MSDATKPESDLNWTALAKQLGTSRRSILSWRKLPGAPSTPDLSVWEIFVEDNELGTGKKPGKEREKLLTERVRKQNRLLDIDIAKKERALVDRADVDAMLLEVSGRAKVVLYQKFEREFPSKAAGLSVAEMGIIGRSMADEVVGIFANGFADWTEAK